MNSIEKKLNKLHNDKKKLEMELLIVQKEWEINSKTVEKLYSKIQEIKRTLESLECYRSFTEKTMKDLDNLLPELLTCR